MKNLRTIVFILAAVLGLNLSAQTTLSKAERKAGEAEALAVIERFTEGKLDVKVQLTLPKDKQGRDSYAWEMKGQTLLIKASDGVAACRGFYDWVKEKGAGISSWSGKRFELPADLTTAPKTVTSAYRDHQYMNVVTYGYTAPFWDEARWDREIDWMALHGIDMPLLLLAQEQVYREVFMDMGLTKEEIDKWEVGPAHLPWMRMGNLSGNSFDGPLGEDWNNRQVALCKHVIDRMRKLGMKPICPAFGGFVPKDFVKHYKGTIDLTGWDWVPDDYRNHRLNPGSEAFVEVGTRFIKKWEEKFGKFTYYLSDSFNEMAIPNDPALMTAYGDAIYKSIRDANPDAVWTMQGWTLGYQRSSWGNGILQALLKNVPDDKFMALDMATDYNYCFWHAPYDWDTYDGFYGKEWVWSVIPNMGGKTAMTGFLDYYANARLTAQRSPNKGNLTGYGFAPEGVENNELLYELITDGGWVGATDSIPVNQWLQNYAQCRYGKAGGERMNAYHQALQSSVYNSFQDHPQFAWQVRNNIIGKGNVNQNQAYCTGVENLFAALKPGEKVSDLLQADLIEAAALYTSGKIENLNARIQKAVDAQQTAKANELLKTLENLMLRLDRALTAHPLYNLENWEKQAMDMATSAADKQRNAVNARRIVSVWYGNHQQDEPVNDYACRVWAGLIRDYYLPRVSGTWNKKINGTAFDQIAFENQFVNAAPNLSAQPALQETELIPFLQQLLKDAKEAGELRIEKLTTYELSNGVENHWYTIHCGTAVNDKRLQVLTVQREGTVAPQQDLKSGEQFWRFLKNETGDVVAENRWGKTLTLAEVQAIAGQRFTLEAAPVAMIPEVISSDCERWLTLLENYKTPKLYGKKGQPVSLEKYNEAKALLEQWRDNIAHASYNAFLAAWTPVWNGLLVR